MTDVVFGARNTLTAMINVAGSISVVRRIPAWASLVVGLLASVLSIFGDFWK
jgi:hypothetical protein